jgi:hypothetical protein
MDDTLGRFQPPNDGPPGFPPPPDSRPPGFPPYNPYGYQPGPPAAYPLDLGRILELTFSMFRFRWRIFVAISLAIMVPAWIVLSITTAAFYTSNDWYTQVANWVRGGEIGDLVQGFGGAWLANVVISAIVGIAGSVTLGAVTYAAATTYSGGVATASDSIRRSLSRLPTYLGIFLITLAITFTILMIGVLVGVALFFATASDGRPQPGPLVFFGLIVFVAAFVALVFIVIRFAFNVTVLMLESTGAIDALRRSWRLASGSSWRVLGYLLVFGLIVGLAGGLISAGVNLAIQPVRATGLTTFTVDPIRLAIATFVSGLIEAVLMPIPAIGTMLLYFDLRWRRGETVPQPGTTASATPMVPPPAR